VRKRQQSAAGSLILPRAICERSGGLVCEAAADFPEKGTEFPIPIAAERNDRKRSEISMKFLLQIVAKFDELTNELSSQTTSQIDRSG
jgi:hypothetical protein